MKRHGLWAEIRLLKELTHNRWADKAPYSEQIREVVYRHLRLTGKVVTRDQLNDLYLLVCNRAGWGRRRVQLDTNGPLSQLMCAGKFTVEPAPFEGITPHETFQDKLGSWPKPRWVAHCFVCRRELADADVKMVPNSRNGIRTRTCYEPKCRALVALCPPSSRAVHGGEYHTNKYLIEVINEVTRKKGDNENYRRLAKHFVRHAGPVSEQGDRPHRGQDRGQAV